MRLIEADALRDEFMSIPPDCGLMYTSVIAKMIDDTPAIDPENMRPHGKWSGMTCSNCGESTSFYYDCNYCPNCGAKMEQEDDNETD